jgi:DNA modification methylase
MRELADAADEVYDEFKNLCVWSKSNAGMGSLYRSAHELIFVYKHGRAKHINNVELGRFGRNRTNIWPYPSMSSFGKERDAALAGHPTTKPLALVSDAILDCSKRGGIVLDAFAGSGTTLLAAEKTGRRGYGIELDPHYADVVVQRFDDLHGMKTIHLDLKSSFDQLRSERTQSRINEERPKVRKVDNKGEQARSRRRRL